MTSLSVTVTASDRSGHTSTANALASIDVDRSMLILGVDKPGPDNTGVLPGVARTVVTTHTPVAGGVYTNLDIMRDIRAPNGARTSAPIIYRNCRIRGNATAPTGFTALVVATNQAGHPPMKFYDCTFDPQLPHLWTSGLLGYGCEFYRCDMSRVVDGFSVFWSLAGHTADDSGVIIEQCYVHDHQWSSHDAHTAVGQTSNADGGHPDCVQLQGMINTRIRGNYFTGKIAPEFGLNFYGTNDANSCFMIKPDVGLISGLDISLNWLGGGSATVNITSDPPDRVLTNVGAIKNNIFDNNARVYTFVKPISIACDVGSGSTINRYSDTGAEITYTRGA